MEDGKVDRLMDVHEIPIPQFLVRCKQVDANRRRRAVVVIDEGTEEKGKAPKKQGAYQEHGQHDPAGPCLAVHPVQVLTVIQFSLRNTSRWSSGLSS